MRSLIAMFVLLGFSSIGLSQEPAIAPKYVSRPSVATAASQPPVPLPVPLYCAPTPVSPNATTPTLADSRITKIEHLQKAAEHLDAAGLHEDAKQIRVQADRERADAAGDIKTLQAEIERLRPLAQHPTQVLLKLRVIELSRTKLQKKGVDFSKAAPNNLGGVAQANVQQGNNATTASFGVFDTNDPFFPLLDAQIKAGLAKVLSEPTLVTVSGRAASFRSGGEIAIPSPHGDGSNVEYKQYGTAVNFVPILMANQNIRLELRASVSELDHANSVKIAGATVPGIRTRSVDIGAEFRPGQTLVLGGLASKQADEEMETLFLVTPEIVAPMLSANASPASSTASKPATPSPAEKR